jgi:PKD repeat protein
MKKIYTGKIVFKANILRTILWKFLFSIFFFLLFSIIPFYGIGQCQVNISGDGNICFGESVILTAVASGGTPQYTYSWSSNPVGLPLPNTPSITVTPSVTTTYTVTITDSDTPPCSDSDQKTVTVNPLPNPSIFGDNCVCPGESKIYSCSPGAGFSYNWTVNGLGTITGGQGSNQITVLWNSIGSEIVSLTETINLTGCFNTVNYPVNIEASPIANFSFTDNQCSGTAVAFTNTSTGNGLTFSWNFGDPTSGTNTSTLQNPTHTFTTYGCSSTSYNVTLTVTSACGCTSSITKTINIKQKPNPQLEDVDLISPFNNCDNNPNQSNPNFTLTVNNITTITSCIVGYSIDWGDGNIQNYLPSFTSATHTYFQLGSFNLVFTATGGSNCVGSTTYIVANQSNPAVGVSNNQGSTTGCAPITFSFTIYGAAINSPGTYYRINFGDGNIIIKTNEELLVDSIVSHSYTSSSCGAGLPGDQFTLIVTAINACDSTSSQVNGIKVYKPPIAGFTMTPSNIGCVNLNVCFTNTTIPGYTIGCSTNTTYLWDFGDGQTSTAQSPPCHIYTSPGTYIITLTAGNSQCQNSSTDTETICINPQPNSSFIVDVQTGCKPLTINTTNTSTTPNTCGDLVYTWSVVFNGSLCDPTTGSWTFTGGTNAFSTNPIILFNDPGTYTLTLAVQNSCTTVTSTKTITVKTVPKVTVNPISPICEQGIVNPTATFSSCYGTSPLTYLWTFPGGTPGSSTNNSPGPITYTSAGTFIITASATNECGPGSDTTTLTVSSVPVPTLTGPTPVCVGTAGSVYTTQAGMSNYQWSVSAGGTITAGTGTNSITVTWNTVGSQTVSVNYTQGGCAGLTPTVYNVTVNPRPIPMITGPATVCVGTTGSVYTTQAGMTNYQWTVSAGGTITGGTGTNSITITWNIAGSQIVTVNYSNSFGCPALSPTSYSVTVNPLPVPTISGTSTPCVGNTIVYTTQAGMSNYIWAVSAGGTITAGGTSFDNSVTVTWNTPGAQWVSINYTNTNGCTATAPVVYPVTVNTLPNPSLSGPATVCVGTAGSVYTTQAGMSNYQWSVSPGGTITAGGTTTSNTVTVTWNSVGPQTISINYSQAGCPATGPFVYNIMVNPRPSPTITGPNNICEGIAGNVYTTESGMTVYTWTVSPGGNITAGTGTNSITVTWNTAGAQTVTVNYSNSFGCPALSPVSYPITVNPLPVPTISGTSTPCVGNTVVYTTQVGMSNYIWAVSAGGTVTAGGTSSDNTVTVTWNTTGAQWLSINYTNVNGCTAAAPVVYPVTVNTLPNPSITGPATVCVGTTGSVYTTQAGMTNYQWTVSPGGTITAGGTTTSNTVTVTWNSVGPQTVSINYSQAGCPATGPFVYDITVNPRPFPTISGPNTICAGTAGNVYTTEPGMTGYTWTVSAGGTITAGTGTNSITVTWNTAGVQSVTANYSNSFGCPALSPTSYSVTVNPLPTPTITGPAPVCVGSSAVYITEANMTNYSWTVSAGGTITGSNNTNSVSITWNVIGPQTITVTYNNSFGCNAVVPTSFPMVVNSLADPTISGPDSICMNSTGNVYNTQPSMSNYIWTVSSGGTITAGGTTTSNSVTVTWTSTGGQTVSVNYALAGCPASSPKIYYVTVHPLPTVNAGADFSIPYGTSTTLSGSSSPGTYLWTSNPAGKISSGGNTLSPFTTNLYSTTIFTLNTTSDKGCQKSDVVIVTPSGDPLSVTANVNPGTICVSESAQLSSTGAGGSGSYTYSWTCSPPGIPPWSSNQQNPIVSPPQTTTYTVTVNDGFNTATASVTLIVNPLPTIYAVIGGGQYCFGGTGVPVGLSNSQTGVSYQLYNNGTQTGSAVNGSGGPITFGNQTLAGDYTVQGTGSLTGCINWMSDTVQVIILPLPNQYNVTGGGSYPAGGIGLIIGLSNSQTGVEYELILDGTTVILPRIPGTGTAISFGYQTAAGLYTVKAYSLTNPVCEADMIGSATIIINPWPTVFDLLGGGDICADDSTGKPVWLDGTEIGVNYQLKRDGINIGPIVPGTGDSLLFGYYNEPGQYTATGANATTGLLKPMNGVVVITVNPLPIVYVLGSFGDNCPGTEIILNGSQAGVNYVLRFELNPIDTLAGTGSVLNFGPWFNTGNYTVYAYFVLTGCDTLMDGSITLNPAPIVFNVKPAGVSCVGDTVSITGSQLGILYQLRRDGLFNVGAPIAGTGNPITFGPQYVAGIYTVEASNPLTNCKILMNGTANINPLPTPFTVVPSGDTCAGVSIGLSGSQLNVRYILKRDTLWIDTLDGTGFPLEFGIQTIPGIYTIFGFDLTTYKLCSNEMAGSTIIHPNPIVYNVFPSGYHCVGDSVGLLISEAGVIYQLLRNGNQQMGLMTGTGGPLSFGPQNDPGTYTIMARNQNPQCWSLMNGSAILTPLPLTFSIIPAGDTCSGTIIGLNGSQVGVNYILMRDNAPVAMLSGTGGVLSFGPQTITGIYTVKAYNTTPDSCQNIMIGSTHILQGPQQFTILPAGINCAGDIVNLSGSETGINYQLILNGNQLIGNPVPGTGSPISFGPQTLPGTYTVIATSGSTSCWASMLGTSVLVPIPVVYTMIPDHDTCAATSIGLNGSQPGVVYTLFRDAVYPVSTIAGTGGPISFGPQTLIGTYTVKARNLTADSCSAWMNGSLVIHPLPLAFNVTPAGDNCEPTVIGLSGSQVGINYELLKNGLSTGIILPGTGAALIFPAQMAGVYTVLGESMSLPYCTNLMNGSTVVSGAPVIDAGPDSAICVSASSYLLNATAVNYSTVTWTTSGDGNFINGSTLTPTYILGTLDKVNGTVILTIHVNGTPQCPGTTVTDNLTLTINPLPIANAGQDMEICSNQTAQLNGFAQNYNSVLWNTQGDGSFSNNSVLDPVYTPGPVDLQSGTVTLILTTFGNLNCSNELDKDTLVISIYTLPTATIDGSNSICSGDTTLIQVSLTGTPPWTVHYTDGVTIFTISNIGSSPLIFGVNPSVTTSYSLTGVSDLHCVGTNYSGTAFITVYPTPISYSMTVTDGGSYCEGGQGVNIGLAGSQLGVKYKLILNGIQVNNSIPGTGFPILFGYQTTPGIYKVKAIDTTTSMQCSKWMNDSIIVTVNPLPLVDFQTDSTCIGQLTQFNLSGPDTNNIAIWQWDFGDGNYATYTFFFEPSHLYPVVGAYTVTLLVTDTHGQRQIIHTVNIIPLPVALFANSAPACKNTPIQFNDYSYSNPPINTFITTWIWDFGDGTIDTILFPSNPDIQHQYSTPGNYQVKLTVINNRGCSNFKTENLTIIPNPVANFFYGSAQCEDQSLQFTDISQLGGGGAIVTWNWNFGDPASGVDNTSTIQNPTHSFTGPGSFSVKMVIHNSQGCMDSIEKIIQVQQKPVADFTADPSCFGTPTTFINNSVPNAASIVSYEWDFGDGTPHVFGPGPIIHPYGTPGIFEANLKVTNSNGCIHDTTKQVMVISLPIANFYTNAPQCQGNLVSFFNQSNPTYGYIVTWHWDFGDGNTTEVTLPGNPNVTHLYINSGTYTVQLTVTTNDSCSASKSIQINVIPSPVANFIYSNTDCVNSPVQFTDISQTNGGGPITQWQWNFDDPTSGSNNTSNLQNPVHLFSSAGSFDVQLIINNVNTCVDTIIKQIIINANPSADFIFDIACFGSLTHFTDQSVANGGTITSWDWDFGDGSTHSFEQNPDHMYNLAGTFSVTLTVTNSNGCSKFISKSVLVIPAPTAAFTFSTSNCSGVPVQFTDQSFTSSGYIVKWVWDFNDGTIITINFPTSPDVTHVFSNGGNYNVKLTITTSDSCSSFIINPVNITFAPLANFDYPSTRCEGSAVQFTDLSQQNGGGPIMSWNWNFGDPTTGVNNTSTAQNPYHIFSNGGTFQVQLIITNISNCKDTILKPVDINHTPLADFVFDTVCESQFTHFTDSSTAVSGTITGWLWNFGDGGTSTLQNPVHQYLLAGSYTVTLAVTNSAGCIGDTSKQIIVNVTPSASFSFSGNCKGSETQFTDLSSTASGTINGWQWDFGDGGSSTEQNPVHTYTTEGIFDVKLIVMNSSGCSDSIVLPITIFTTPTAQFSYSNTFCPAGRVSFFDQSTAPNTSIVSWYWEFEPGYFSTDQNPIFNYSETDTNYAVKLIVTDGHGCMDTIIDTVYVKPGFQLVIQSNDTCFGNPNQFHAGNVATGDPLHNFHWNFGEPGSSSNTSDLENPEHTYEAPGTYLVRLTAWNSDNCVDSTYREVIVYPGAIADFSYDQGAHCTDTTVIFTNLSNGNGVGIDTLIWTFGDGTKRVIAAPFPVPDTVHHHYQAFGIYPVTIEAVNSNGCRGSKTTEILVTCISTSFSQADTVICQRALLLLTDNSIPVNLIDQWYWDFGDGQDTTYFNQCSTLTHSYQQPGLFYIKLVISTTVNGITISDSSIHPILVKVSPLAGFNASAVCLGDTTKFINLSDSNNVSIISYYWRFGDPLSGTQDTSTLINPAHAYTHFGNFDAKLIIGNEVGCFDSIIKPLIVHKLPVADFSFPSLICSRAKIEFEDQSAIGDTSGLSWVWYFGNPYNPSNISIEQNPTFYYNIEGSYNVLLTVKDLYGCDDSVSKTINVLPSPISSFTVDENVDGISGRVNVFNTSVGSNAYLWNFGNGETSNDENPDMITYEQEGTYIIKLIAWANNECSDTTTYKYELLFKGLYIPNAFAPLTINIGTRYFTPIGVGLKQFNIQVFDVWGHLLWESNELDAKGRPQGHWDGIYNGKLLPQGTYMWKASGIFSDGTIWEGSDIDKGSVSTCGTVTLLW